MKMPAHADQDVIRLQWYVMECITDERAKKFFRAMHSYYVARNWVLYAEAHEQLLDRLASLEVEVAA